MDELKVKEFITTMTQDEAFQTQMQACKTPEEALATVKAYGFDFELEEFKTLMTGLLINIKESKGEDLTDEELDAVAGGKSEWAEFGEIIGISVGVTAVLEAAMFAA